jgi:hypothetical protein
MLVRMHHNLSVPGKGGQFSSEYHRGQPHRAWTLQYGEGPQRGLLYAIVDGAILRNVTFPVSEAGRQRVLKFARENPGRTKKNPHAYAVGELVRSWPLNTMPASEAHTESGVRVSYNPYKADHFVRLDCLERVDTSPLVFANGDGLFAKLGQCRSSSGLRGLALGDDWDNWAG